MKFGGEVECVIRTNCLDFVEVPNPGVWTVKGGLDKVSPQGGVRLCVCVCVFCTSCPDELPKPTSDAAGWVSVVKNMRLVRGSCASACGSG